MVYWSDVRERTIHRVNLDGSSPGILLDASRGIGVVDGIIIIHSFIHSFIRLFKSDHQCL